MQILINNKPNKANPVDVFPATRFDFVFMSPRTSKRSMPASHSKTGLRTNDPN
jgi:hypothetical protein